MLQTSKPTQGLDDQRKMSEFVRSSRNLFTLILGKTYEIPDPLEPGNPLNHENTNPIQKWYAGEVPGKYKTNTEKIPAGIHAGRRGKEQIHVQYVKNTRKIQIHTPDTPKIHKKYTINIQKIPKHEGQPLAAPQRGQAPWAPAPFVFMFCIFCILIVSFLSIFGVSGVWFCIFRVFFVY